MKRDSITRAGIAAGILTSQVSFSDPRRAFCNDCRGKGFDLTREPGKRSSRKCPRCRGAGSIAVGSTKR